MGNSVRLIVNGPEDLLAGLREDLAKVLLDHSMEVIEKGHPRPGRNQQHVMYMTGSPVVPEVEVEVEYIPFEEG